MKNQKNNLNNIPEIEYKTKGTRTMNTRNESNNIPEIEHKDRAQEDKMRFHDPMPVYSPITGELVPMPEPKEYDKGTAWSIISADKTMTVEDITRLAKEEYQDILIDDILEEAFNKRDMKMWRKRLTELDKERTREIENSEPYKEKLRAEIKRIEEKLEQEHGILSMLRIQLNGSFTEEEADDTMEMIDSQYAIMDGLEALLEDLWERQGEGRTMDDWNAELNAKYDAGPGVKPSHALFEKMLGAVEEIDDSDEFIDDDNLGLGDERENLASALKKLEDSKLDDSDLFGDEFDEDDAF